MITALINTLNRYTTLTNQEIAIIKRKVKLRHFKKGELFLEEGKPSRNIGFVLSGVFRFFIIDEQGEETTFLFFKEGGFLIELNSFHEDAPSFGTFQAETNGEVLVITRADWQQLGTLIKNWNFITKRMSQEVLIRELRFHRKLINQDALQSYQDFLDLYPTIAQRVPDHHLASFMGITKHTLSRIRKKIASKDKS